MQGRAHFFPVRNCFLSILVMAVTSGCLTEESPDEADATPENETEAGPVDNQVSGSVGDGPIVDAVLRAYRSDGAQLAEFTSGTDASYSVTIRTKGLYYPLLITSTGGTDLVTNLAPDFDMSAVATSPKTKSVANVNPFSTFTVELARELPGRLTTSNILIAQEMVSEALNSGLGSLAASGPMTTRIDEHNIAEIVKASETLAETVRRTRNLLSDAGYASGGNAVIETLASDLVDEVIDGRGGAATDARTAALMTVVYAQVLVESMANELHVNGSDATSAMNQSIHYVLGHFPSTTISELPVTAGMLDRSRIGLAAAFAFDGRARVAQLRDAVDGMQAGMSALQVRAAMPEDYRSILQSTLSALANADMAAINEVNDIARGGTVSEGGNRAPEIAGEPAAAIEVGADYVFSPSASDPDGDQLTFGIVNLPSWAGFDATNGRLTGTPAAGDVGTFADIVISVSDGESSASLAPFAIEVVAGNVAPTISGTPGTEIEAGGWYAFRPTASDSNGDELTFSISNKPHWAKFSPITGGVSGDVTESDVGSYDNIVISVSDGQLTDSLPPFSITVESAPATNTPPTIMGDPPTELNAGSSYSFTPEADDADGDALTFAVVNRPSWANFNASNGALTGTPGTGDVGVYSNVRISVSDGTDTASMEFTITVNAVSLGSVELTWTPPTQNEDGSQLLDLAGYRIYWGTSSGNYTDSVTIDNPGLTSFLVENLAPGTYEFVATSFNNRGTESEYSNPKTKIVN